MTAPAPPALDPTRREGRAALLALADRDRLVELAADCLRDDEDQLIVVHAPETGMVMLQVREPVVGERFHLGEVVVTRAEVVFRGAQGWTMRLGTDHEATLAGAICDAEFEADGPGRAAVDDLCRDTARRRAADDAAEWAELAPTAVEFEELD